MKKIFTIFLLFALLSPITHAQSIHWNTIEKAAPAENNNGKKLYFVDFFTNWCGWCKRMDRETFTDATVAKILNKYYIPVKFNAEGNADFTWKNIRYTNTSTAPGQRPSVHSFAKYILGQQMGFPSFVIFGADQSTLTILQGYKTKEELPIILWYFCSGDYLKYSFEQYLKIFDKEIRHVMLKAIE